MKSMKSHAHTKASTHGTVIAYQQSKRKIFVEPIEDTIAVRCLEGMEDTVCAKLRSLGRVQVVTSQQLIIVKFRDPTQRMAALKQLQQWMDEGVVKFATPVLCDSESQLHQILTDEIIVRFKSVLPPEQLKEVEDKYGLSVVRQNEFVPNQFVVKVMQSVGLRTLEVASEIDAMDEVEFATPNFISEFRR